MSNWVASCRPIKVAHFRLTFSRRMFVVAYPRETQEMVFDAHNRAFAFFGGVHRPDVTAT
jgi:transposase